MVEGFPCTFYSDVICPHKKCACVRLIAECFKCSHYFRFMREMEEEEDNFFEEVKKMRGSE